MTLLAALADVLDRLDPPPARLVTHARDALATRLHADPLDLLTDSARTTPGGMRGTGHRTMRFTDLDLRLEPTATGLRLTGHAPAGHATAHWPGGTRTTAVDPDGWFHLDHVPPGPLRVVLDGARATPWFVA
ncbi:hypothetical protein [Saccharothrix obliqua]|uniref:hypothetical protein n=1 Tax=Saccharothrix obliqua TaxID=2861747 RepID=UPI001C5F6E9D|nr:hypothetical protein [Saccharothrix obliqua]MBW4715789.1 hypothetical protein [Saccharothrix obliqua]